MHLSLARAHAESHWGRLKFHIPGQRTTLSELFSLLDEARCDPKIPLADFAVSQPTLEQIFIAIARERDRSDERDRVELQESLVAMV